MSQRDQSAERDRGRVRRKQSSEQTRTAAPGRTERADGSREEAGSRLEADAHPALALQRSLGNAAVQRLAAAGELAGRDGGVRARGDGGSSARGQTAASGPAVDRAGSPAEREARRAAETVAGGGEFEVRRRTAPRVARQERPSGGTTEPTEEEFQAERQRFRAEQAEFFREVGEAMARSIRERAGLSGRARLSTPEQALKVVRLWGVTLDGIVRQLPAVGSSLSGRITGRQTASDVAQRRDRMVQSLSREGREAYRATLEQVRAEPFWAEFFDRHEVYVIPSRGGTGRYAGYIQRGTATDEEGRRSRMYVVRLSRERLEAGEVEASAATLVHELSHAVHEPAVLERSLSPFVDRLSELLVDHPRLQALREDADDPGRARAAHRRNLRQLLYERTGYAEEEIFVHLQQLTHQPDVPTEGGTVTGSRYVLHRVELYVERLRNVGLPQRTLRGILDSLARRVARLYDRRIRAAPEGSRRRRLLEVNKDLALNILDLARSQGGSE